MELQAKQRLESFRGNAVLKTRLNDVVDDFKKSLDRVDFEYFKSIGDSHFPVAIAEKGPYVIYWITDEDDEAHVFASFKDDPTEVVGMLHLQRSYDDGYWHTEISSVNNKHQGQGLGYLMYTSALKKLGELASSDNLSKGSSKLWQRLVTEFKGVLVVPLNKNGDEAKLPVKSWKVHEGVTYPVFTYNGEERSLYQILDDSQDRSRRSSGGSREATKSMWAAANSFYMIKK